MQNHDDHRPDPDALLERVQAAAEKKNKGRLKIFFGGCAGVGKTYAMLSAAREHIGSGEDVIVGLVETHKREDTVKVLQGLPLLPPRRVEHRGVMLDEFDLDAALARKPALILIDELAHTNAPGSRHPKRWQDVEELLDAGIDVYSTLNVQHLESLNDVVAGITGVWVKETVPDAFFDQADDITLVDITTDELLKRLSEGKVYIAPQTRKRAAQNFFKKSNLIALRELALRRTAERVDAQMSSYRVEQGIHGAQSIAEKVMVCVGPDPLSLKVVRAAKRMATALKAPWTAIYVENARHYRMSEKQRENVETTLKLAERMGGKTVVIQGDNAAEELLDYAHTHGVTKIVAGKPAKGRWQDLFYGSLVDKIIRKSGDIDVYVITSTPDDQKKRPVYHSFQFRRFRPALYVYGVLAIALCSALNGLLAEMVGDTDLMMIYLIGVVSVAAQCGRGPSILASFLAIAAFNLLFGKDTSFWEASFWEGGTMDFSVDASTLMSLMVMLVTSVIISSQASKLRLQAIYARKRERNVAALYALTKGMSATRGHRNIADVAGRQICEVFDADVTIWMPEPDGDLGLLYGSLSDEDFFREETAARWCMEHGHPAGIGTSTLPNSKGLYVPLHVGTDKPLGVLGAVPRPSSSHAEGQTFTTEKMENIENFATLLAAALERANTADDAERLRVEAETDKLRGILLNSISQDLRTPLDTIVDITNALVMDSERYTEETRQDDVRLLRREAERLSRVLSNLLDATNLEAGNARLNLQRVSLTPLIERVLELNEPILNLHQVRLDLLPVMPDVMVDLTLMEQVLENLLENAAKYAPPQTEITLKVRESGQEIILSIADQGIGVAEEDMPFIFDKFFVSTHHNAPRSTGFGLSICKRIMEVHQGRIWVQKNPDGGAIFMLALPMAA
jgi:two-component system sensor histidine kinase KdpD